MTVLASPRRTAVALGLLTFVVGAVLVAPARSQAAADVAAVGWWSDRPGAVPQPDGGFEVADALDGTSVAAVRLEIGSASLTSLVLVLNETTGVGPPTGTVRACAVTDAWDEANPGALAEAPKADCAAAVELARDDAGVWSGDVATLVAGAEPGSTVSVALVGERAPLAGLPVSTGFQASFSGAQVIAGGAGTDSGSPTTVAPPASGGFDLGTPPPAATPLPVDGGLSFDQGMADLAPPPPGPASGPPVSEETADELAIPSLGTGPIGGAPGPSRPWHRLAVLVPVSALVGGAGGWARRFALDRSLLGDSA